MYKRILVATDGSKLSNTAVGHAIGLASATGAEIVALRVVPRYPQAYFEGAMALAAADVARIEKQWQEDAVAALNAVKAQGEKLHVKVKPLTVKSDLVAQAIIATAKRQNVDLIVMASHGRKGIKRLLLGSETQQVLTHSPIAVLVLR